MNVRSVLALSALTLVSAGCGGPGASSNASPPSAPAAAEPAGWHTAYVPASPLGIELTADMIPADNPVTPAKVELGRRLYFDPRLSRDLTVSCASCHNPVMGYSDDAPTSTGIRGQRGGRSAPTVLNRALSGPQFWDGRAASLEEQAVGPIGNPIEMGFTVEEAAARLNNIPDYAMRFKSVFGGPATPDRIGKAIATFERTVLVGDAPNDFHEAVQPFLDEDTGEPLPPYDDDTEEDRAHRAKVVAGWKANPLSPEALRGRGIYFGKGQCSLCHVGPNLADEQYHNIGVGMDAAKPDLGRYDFTKKDADKGAFRTPTMRNIADTAPYMHDGSQATLEEVVEFYDKGGHPNPWLSNKIKKLNLTGPEKADLVAFLKQGLQGKVAAIPGATE